LMSPPPLKPPQKISFSLEKKINETE